MTNDTTPNIDRQNRIIEQDAQTDADLESVVSPRSGITATFLRIGIAVFGLAVIAWVAFQAF